MGKKGFLSNTSLRTNMTCHHHLLALCLIHPLVWIHQSSAQAPMDFCQLLGNPCKDPNAICTNKAGVGVSCSCPPGILHLWLKTQIDSSIDCETIPVQCEYVSFQQASRTSTRTASPPPSPPPLPAPRPRLKIMAAAISPQLHFRLIPAKEQQQQHQQE